MKFIVTLLFGLFLISCSNESEDIIYNNETFQDIVSIANRKNKAFCIVLIDSTQNSTQKHCFNIRSKKRIADNAIYNIVDINFSPHEWYMKWVYPMSLPLTCIFSKDGLLVDLIPGATKETFLYTKEAISNMKMTKYHYPNRFNLTKQRVIPLLNQILKCKTDLERGIYTSTILDNSIDSLKYPFPYYLKIVGELMENDTIESRLIAKSMLELENPYSLELFRNEFIVAKSTLYPNFNINDEPNIRVDKNVIYLADCRLGEEIPITVLIYNDGNRPLDVLGIFTSCSCLKQINYTEKFTVSSKDSTVVNFKFKAGEQGEAIRDIFIASNAINKPILYVKVQANIL